MRFLKISTKRQIHLVSILICIPILLIILIFNIQFRGPIQNKFYSDYSEEIKNQVTNVNKQFDQIEGAAYTLNLSLSRNKIIPEVSTVDQYLNLKEVSNKLLLLENGSPIIEKARIVVHSSNPYLITSSGTSVNDIEAYKNFTMNNKKESQLWKETKGNLYLFQKINSINQGEILLFVQIKIDGALKNISSPIGQGYSMIVPNNGMEPFGNFPKKFSEKIKSHSNPNSNQTFLGNRYFIETISHQRLNGIWKYYIAVSFDDTFNMISKVSNILVFVSLIGLFLTFIFTRLYNRIFFRPFQKLVRLVAKGDEIADIDEIEYLKLKWQEMTEKQMKSNSANKQNTEKLKINFINQLISGRYFYYTNDELFRKGNEIGITIEKRYIYHLLIIQLTGTIHTKEEIINEDENFFGFVLNNISIDLAETCFADSIVVSSSTDNLIFLVSCENEIEIEKFYGLLCEKTNSILEKWISLIVGRKISQWNELRDVFEDAKNAKGFQTITLNNQIIYAEKKKPLLSEEYRPGVYMIETKLIDNLKDENLEKMKKELENFVLYFIEKKLPQKYFMSDAMRLYTDIKDLLEQNGISHVVIISEQLFRKKILSNFHKNKIEILIANELLLPAFEAIQNYQSITIESKTARVINYLNDNFGDPSLSLEQTSEKFQLDIYLLRKELKEKLGMSYIDYLTDLRINSAKKMLRETDEQISEIAKKVGYQSSYFNRIFKKKTGITPGVYRKSGK
jgi:AraC-like DNA-binding protein